MRVAMATTEWRLRDRLTITTTLLTLFTLLATLVVQSAQGKQTAYACEGTMLRLECESGRLIHLIRAIYGRFSITICNENGNTEWSVNCGSPKSILVLNGTCNYQRSCAVMASTKTFGDPCPGTVKYLEVQYQCISASSLSSTTTLKPALISGGGASGGGARPNLPSPWLNQPAGGGGAIIVPAPAPGDLPPQIVPPPAVPPTTTPSAAPRDLDGAPTTPGPGRPAGPPKSPPGVTGGRGKPVRPARPPPESEEPDYRAWDEDDDDEDEDGDEEGGEGVGGEGNGAGGGDMTESSWDWTQFERERPPKEGGGAGAMDGMWSDNNNNGNGNVETVTANPPAPGPAPAPAPTQISRHANSNSNGGHSPPSPGVGGGAGAGHCIATWKGDMFWNWTSPGSVARQPCPGGASGLARWTCIRGRDHGNRSPSWFPGSPDLSDCKSAWFQSLLGRVLEDPNISNVASDLAQVTSTKQMYGGDVIAAVQIIKTIAVRMGHQLRALSNQVSREDLAAELLQLILDAASNLLEKQRLESWAGLSYGDAHGNVTALLVALEDNAFLLANVVNTEKVLRRTSKNVLATIYAVETSNVREISFPIEGAGVGGVWGHGAPGGGDLLRLPAEALRENSDGGLVRLVAFAYNNLQHVLQPIEAPSNEERGAGGGDPTPVRARPLRVVNSRVLSASLNQGRHIQLALPVQLTFSHIWLDNVSNPACVFWDYTLNAWSEEGCRVLQSNRSHTDCQCTHLTNFAILMDVSNEGGGGAGAANPQLLQVVMWIGSSVLILCLALTLLITHFCIHGKVFQTMILKNLFLCVLLGELIFVLGIHETSSRWLCTPLALLQHYLALASILWLFLHGFHLHLIVVEAAESGLSRQVWYYGVSYGSPAIVVLLSFLLDTVGYRSETVCWIQTSFALLCFVGPAIIVASATLAVLSYTSYKVCGLLTSLPKKPNDDSALYVYAGTWLRGSLLILVVMTTSWTLRLLLLDSSPSSSVPLTYATALSLVVQGVAILLFHALKADSLLRKFCDCGKSSGSSSETEMSTHSQAALQLQSGLHGPGIATGGHAHTHTHQRGLGAGAGAAAPYLTVSRQQQQAELRNQESLYAKQLAGVIQPSPGGLSGSSRYDPDNSLGGLYNKGLTNLDGGHWTPHHPHPHAHAHPRGGLGAGGGSYSDIRNPGYAPGQHYHYHREPVYEEIERRGGGGGGSDSPRSPGGGGCGSGASDPDYLSEEDEEEGSASHSHLYPHEIDLYNRSLYAPQQQQQYRHRHLHTHTNSKDRRKGRDGGGVGGGGGAGGEVSNPLLSRNQQQQLLLLQQQQQNQILQQQLLQQQAQYATRAQLQGGAHVPRGGGAGGGGGGGPLPEHLHHLSHHPDDHILQNVHMV